MVKVSSNYFTYRSVFAPYIEGFLREKEQKGLLKGNMLKCYMLEFDRFFQQYNMKDLSIKRETIVAWRATRINDNERNLYHKYIAWIHFCKYLCNLGVDCYIPRTPNAGRQNDYIPYVFTHKEISTIFFMVDSLRIRKNGNRTVMFALPALCRLLYSTGVRIGEALAIKNKDIDLENRTISILDTKNDRQRVAGINESLLNVLEQYIRFKENNLENKWWGPDEYFFVSQLGKVIPYCTIQSWFRRILYFCNIPCKASFNQPRLHDLRHTAAVHSLEKLIKNGMDIYCALPLISLFLGHKNIKSTETYVKLTYEAFPDLIMESRDFYIFPPMNKTYGNDD